MVIILALLFSYNVQAEAWISKVKRDNCQSSDRPTYPKKKYCDARHGDCMLLTKAFVCQNHAQEKAALLAKQNQLKQAKQRLQAIDLDSVTDPIMKDLIRMVRR